MENTMTKEYSLDYGFEKGYLKKKTVILKPVKERSPMKIMDVNKIQDFMYTGAIRIFILPKNEKGDFINPFENDDERMFFEKTLNQNLNPYDKYNTYWDSYKVVFRMDPSMLTYGMSFDMSDPNDVLRVKVLKCWKNVAPNWAVRLDSPLYQFAIVDEDFEEDTASKSLAFDQKLFMHYGSLKTSIEKMRNFVSIFHIEKKDSKIVPDDASERFLDTEIEKIIKGTIKDKELMLNILEDKGKYEIKLLAINAINIGAIQRSGFGNFTIPGDVVAENVSFDELIDRLINLKKITDKLYLKIEAQVETHRKKQKLNTED